MDIEKIVKTMFINLDEDISVGNYAIDLSLIKPELHEDFLQDVQLLTNNQCSKFGPTFVQSQIVMYNNELINIASWMINGIVGCALAITENYIIVAVLDNDKHPQLSLEVVPPAIEKFKLYIS
jgi:hypothetical protein